jgi:hypothetical protein
MKYGALIAWYFINAVDLNAYGHHYVVLGVNSNRMPMFHQLRHRILLGVYLRVVKRVFHSHHEISHLKHAYQFSHLNEEVVCYAGIMHVDVACVNHEA